MDACLQAGGPLVGVLAVTTTTAQPVFITSDKAILGGGLAMTVVAGLAYYAGWPSVVGFVFAAAAVGILAALVGRSVEQLGDRFGPGATGVLQSALGNLPELFICIFALRAGLVDVVKAALIGSILANLLLVLGPGLPRRRPQARHPAARLGAGPHDRRADDAVGDRDGAAVARH